MSSFLGKLDWTREEVEELLKGAVEMIPAAVDWYRLNHHGLFPPTMIGLKDHPFFQGRYDLAPLKGKVLSQTIEATTRTGGSFGEMAEYRGLRVVERLLNSGSRGVKGESPLDDAEQHALQGMNLYILRTPFEGEPLFIAEYLQAMGYQIPVINAGDGSHLHPSQALLDLLTILIYRGSLDNLTIGICGDLKEGRTVHSLVRMLKPFNPKIVLVSFGGLKLEEPYREGLNIIAETDGDLTPLYQCDIVYCTRVQRERIAREMDYNAIERDYVIDQLFLDKANPNVLIMHPGPCITEIHKSIRRHPRVIISQQAWLGLPSRIFLINRGMDQYVSVPTFQEGEVSFTEKVIDATQAPERALYYSPVDKGTVIDHVPAGAGEMVIGLLQQIGEIAKDQYFQPARNVPSPTVGGLKDVLLIPDVFISDRAAAAATLIAPKATVNIITGDGLMKKRKYQPPSSFRGNGHCLNPACISNHDGECEKRFITYDHWARCCWCHRSFDLKDILS